MDLRKLHDKLYRKKDTLEKRELSEDRFDPEESHSSNSFMKSTGVEFKDTVDVEKKNFFKRNKLAGIILLTFAALAFLMIIAFFVVRYMQGAYSEEKVLLRVEGVETVDSGGVLEYKITAFNDNRVALNNVSLNLTYSNEIEPKSFDGWQDNGLNRKKIVIGNMESKELKEYKIPFAVFGTKDSRVYLDVTMDYEPANISSSFQKKAQGSSIINAAPLQVEIFPTKEVASGEVMKINLIVDNKSEEFFENVEISINYPEEFSYQESTLSPVNENNKWVIGSIRPAEQEKITITGTLSGEVGSAAPFSVMIGRYDNLERELVRYSEASDFSTIVSSRMEIRQVAKVFGEEISEKDAISSGEVVSYNVYFKNTSETSIKDLVLKQKILSRVIDEGGIVAKGGYYDSENREIVWKASTLPVLKTLAPGEEGMASFSVKLKDEFPADSEKDRNFSLETQSSIESLDVNSPIMENKRIYSDKLVLKVNSRFLFDLVAKYKDDEISNTGPIPLEPGKETTFVSRLNIRNTSNDMENVTFKASLPTGISWKNNYLPKDSDIKFNERSNELVWDIGTIKAGTGFFIPIKSLAFQIGTTPSGPSGSQVQKGIASTLILMNNISISAKDSFTGNIIEESIRDLKLFDVADY